MGGVLEEVEHKQYCALYMTYRITYIRDCIPLGNTLIACYVRHI